MMMETKKTLLIIYFVIENISCGQGKVNFILLFFLLTSFTTTLSFHFPYVFFILGLMSTRLSIAKGLQMSSKLW